MVGIVAVEAQVGAAQADHVAGGEAVFLAVVFVNDRGDDGGDQAHFSHALDIEVFAPGGEDVAGIGDGDAGLDFAGGDEVFRRFSAAAGCGSKLELAVDDFGPLVGGGALQHGFKEGLDDAAALVGFEAGFALQIGVDGVFAHAASEGWARGEAAVGLGANLIAEGIHEAKVVHMLGWVK